MRVSSDAGIVPERCGEEGAEPEGKLSIDQSIYVPTLTCGHELWLATERRRSGIQAAEMSFLRRGLGSA